MSGKKPLVSKALPKAEMHVHIALAMSSDGFLRSIQQERTTLTPDFLLEREERYYFTLKHFHEKYESMRNITSTQGELAEVTQHYLERIAREGAIYAEISNSYRDPDKFDQQIEAIEEAIQSAKHNTGIETRIVVTGIRNFGVEKAEEAAKHIAKRKHKYVTGFGLAGEEKDSFSAYKKALHIAWHEAGLGLVPHVSEQFMHNAIDFLNVLPSEAKNIKPEDRRRVRAGHATLIHMSTSLMDEFAKHAICIETCLSANKRINLPEETQNHRPGDEVVTKTGNSMRLDRPLAHYFDHLDRHPVKTFIANGIPVCLGSDNPLLMNTNIGKEYSLAVMTGIQDPVQLTENAIRYANVDPRTRMQLMAKVDLYRKQVANNDIPKDTPNGYRHAEAKFTP